MTIVELRDLAAQKMTPEDFAKLVKEVSGESLHNMTSTRKQPFSNQVQDALLWFERRSKLALIRPRIEKLK